MCPWGEGRGIKGNHKGDYHASKKRVSAPNILPPQKKKKNQEQNL